MDVTIDTRHENCPDCDRLAVVAGTVRLNLGLRSAAVTGDDGGTEHGATVTGKVPADA
jgi:hypothetical protein